MGDFPKTIKHIGPKLDLPPLAKFHPSHLKPWNELTPEQKTKYLLRTRPVYYKRWRFIIDKIIVPLLTPVLIGRVIYWGIRSRLGSDYHNALILHILKEGSICGYDIIKIRKQYDLRK